MHKNRSVRARAIEAFIFMVAGGALGWGLLRGSGTGQALWLGSLLAWGAAGWVLGEREATRKAGDTRETVKKSGFVSEIELHAALGREIGLAARRSAPLTLLAIDAKNIDAINRDFDQEAGDESVQAVALVARKSLRETDFIAQTSGVTWCAILPDSTGESAAAAVARTQSALGSILRSHSKGEVRVMCKVQAFAWDGKESGPEFFDRAQRKMRD